MAESSVLDATRLLLQRSAKAHYRGLSEDAKADVCRRLHAAAKQVEGKISLQDFLDLGSAAPECARKGFFRFLDAQSTGFLELAEYITLHYINETGILLCSTCGIPILIGGYSCSLCPPAGKNSYDICLSCYTSPLWPAAMHRHPRTSFVNLVANFQQSGVRRTSLDSTVPSNNKTRDDKQFDSTMPSNNKTRESKQFNYTMPSNSKTREDKQFNYTKHTDTSALNFLCDCCHHPIIMDRYTCKECVSSFDLCGSCYFRLPPHFQHHHPYSSFVRAVQSQAHATFAQAAMETQAATAAAHTDIAAMTANIQAQIAQYMAQLNQGFNYAPPNEGFFPNYAPPKQGSSSISTAVELLTQFLNLSMQFMSN